MIDGLTDPGGSRLKGLFRRRETVKNELTFAAGKKCGRGRRIIFAIYLCFLLGRESVLR